MYIYCSSDLFRVALGIRVLVIICQHATIAEQSFTSISFTRLIFGDSKGIFDLPIDILTKSSAVQWFIFAAESSPQRVIARVCHAFFPIHHSFGFLFVSIISDDGKRD